MTITSKNFSDQADSIMEELCGRGTKHLISYSKLRSMYALAVDILARARNERNEELSDKIVRSIKKMNVRFHYDTKDEAVKVFINRTNLFDEIRRIKTLSQLQLFCDYFEALVAYRKFYD